MRLATLTQFEWSEREQRITRPNSVMNGNVGVASGGRFVSNAVQLPVTFGRWSNIDDDGDGHFTIDSGGDDCDDHDARRYPSAVEVCDTAGIDEDCDLSTVGTRDTDGDRSIDCRCFNMDGARRVTANMCDCDDDRPGVHPRSVEACDRIDNDCDGAVDEGLIGCSR